MLCTHTHQQYVTVLQEPVQLFKLKTFVDLKQTLFDFHVR